MSRLVVNMVAVRLGGESRSSGTGPQRISIADPGLGRGHNVDGEKPSGSRGGSLSGGEAVRPN